MHHGEGLRRLLTAKRIPESEQDVLLGALESGDLTLPSTDPDPDLETDPGPDAEAATERLTLEPADLAILRYAAKLTRRPEAISASDIEELRGHGLADRAIHDVCAITAYYAFVNRIADGLGVELEEAR